MDKKYALILYGNLRSYKKTYPYFEKNLFNINNIDIFISTHLKKNISSHQYEDKNPNNFENIYGDRLKNISYLEEIDYSDLIELLKMKIKVIDLRLYNSNKLEIDNMRTLDDWYKFYEKLNNRDGNDYYLKTETNHKYLLHEIIMLYHRLNAFRQMEKYSIDNNIKYDGVIIHRPDFYFKIPIDLSKFIINDNIIYIRLDFMMISSFNRIKMLVTELLKNYYENIPLNMNLSNQEIYLSETQHNILLKWTDKNLTCFDILNQLLHFRAANLNYEKDLPMSCSGKEDLNTCETNFYQYLNSILLKYR